MERTRTRITVFLCTGVFMAVALLVWLALAWPVRKGLLPKAQLADGRVLQVEGVTFGIHHHIGFRSPIENVRPWLPGKVCDWLNPKYPRSDMQLDHPALVIWVNATDPVTGKQVDCQGIRMEILGQDGDVFGQETSSWYGAPSFWRVGHVFQAYPRTESPLTVQVTPWRTNVSVRFEVPNPHVVQPAAWSGKPLPQRQLVGDLDVAMTGLLLRTNGSANSYWESPARYWLPVWELKQDGQPAAGWEEPEWIAEDPTGNRSRFLGLHQSVLRFSATFYPTATNTQAAVLIGTSQPFSLADLQSNTWWNLKLNYLPCPLTALGVFTNGTHLFLGGVYQTNPSAAVSMGPVRGGAPSGWVGTSRRVTPTRVEQWAGHYTPVPVIYVQAKELETTERLAVRLRDDHGHYWVAQPEPQGHSQGIHPFLLDLLPETKNLVAEFVLLRPAKAEFLVNVPAFSDNRSDMPATGLRGPNRTGASVSKGPSP